MREVGERLLAGLEEYQSTGDRITDLVLCACAGVPRPDYKGEFGGVDSMEWQWAHAKLAGLPFPALVLSSAQGYDLTHQVFYATDYGRAPVQNAEVLSYLLAEVEATTNPDLLCELGVAVYAVGGEVPQSCIDAMQNPVDDHHACCAALLGRYL